jgi:8-oxo-dGTP diphosphatase
MSTNSSSQQVGTHDFRPHNVKTFKVGKEEYLEKHSAAVPTYPNLCVGANVFNKDGKLLVIQRTKKSSFPLTWQVPSGKLEPGEKIHQGALRELKEEAGVEGKVVDFVGTLLFESSKKKRSQEIHFIVKSKHSHPKVTIDKEECAAYAWVTLEEALGMDFTLPDLTLPMIKQAFEKAGLA